MSRAETLREREYEAADEWEYWEARATCHCGARGIEEGGNISTICPPCFEAWQRAGEPEECPCGEGAL